LKLKPASEGFEVTRVYEPIEHPDDVKYDKSTEQWTVKLGKQVRVKLAMTNTRVRYHVALQDKLPAGLEVINTALKTSPVVRHFFFLRIRMNLG